MSAREHPMIFSAPMVRAILNGYKTQTRRKLPIQPPDDWIGVVGRYHPTIIDRHGNEQPGPELFGVSDEDWGCHLKWAPGDRLWVRETWQTYCDQDHLAPQQLPVNTAIQYPATYDGWVSQKRRSVHMPRWASRITLEVTAVKVEPLQNISEDDALAEGAFKGKATGRVFNSVMEMRLSGKEWRNARDWYADLWESINGKGSWDANPWVAVITFRRMESET
jgi:hypothetical protein